MWASVCDSGVKAQMFVPKVPIQHDSVFRFPPAWPRFVGQISIASPAGGCFRWKFAALATHGSLSTFKPAFRVVEREGCTLRTPVHLWLVGVVGLLWNLMGTIDYTMTQTRNAAYLAQFTPEQLAYFSSFPAWVVGFWALAVWSALLGSVLLLLRRQAAVMVFAISFFAMLVTMVHSYVLTDPAFSDVVGTQDKLFSLAIFVAALGQWFYARRMRMARVLH